MPKRARVTTENTHRALGIDLLDRILEGEGLAEVVDAVSYTHLTLPTN